MSSENYVFKGNVSTCTDVEALKGAMRKAVQIRDQMGGAMYYNMFNDEATRYANRLAALGVPRGELLTISNGGMR